MKLKLFFIGCYSLIFFQKSLFSQVAYYDARDLEFTIIDNKIIINGTDVNYKILANYVSKKEPKPSDITTGFEDNPFFKVAGIQMEEGTKIPVFKRVSSAIGGLNVTNFADGLARFMVKRFKEELNLAFFQKFRDEINKPEYTELQILFPETHKLLLAIGDEIYRYNVYIMTLREAFIKDLTNIFSDLRKLIDLPKYQDFLDQHPVFNTILVTSLYVIDGLSHGTHAGDILADFPVADLKFKPGSELSQDIVGQDMQGAINTLKIFSASLRSQSPDRYWIRPGSLLELFKGNDNTTFRIYLGLIYQTALKNNGVTFQDNKKLTDVLTALAADLENLKEYRKYIESFVDKAEEVNEYVSELKDKKKSDIDYNDYYKLFSASIELVNHSFGFIQLPHTNFITDDKKAEITTQANYWIFVANACSEVYVDTRTKNYSSAILNTTILLDTLFKDPSSKVKPLVLKYGTFMATVAAAENSDEVATAIEAVALPAGGSGIKKHSDFNISIQSYLGGSYGSETIKELKNNQTKNVASVFAPVGVSFNWGLFKKCKNPGSIGLHLNLLDIGALASFRFKDTATAISSDIQLKNILAPGIYLAIGIPRWPLSVGYGLQAGPQLREIKEGTPSIETDKIYTRSSFFVAVDIPLLTLYNRAR